MAEYEAEGDGFDTMETQDPIIQAAADGDIPEPPGSKRKLAQVERCNSGPRSLFRRPRESRSILRPRAVAVEANLAP